MKERPIILIGASGSGKTELSQYLIYKHLMNPITSTTSREPRKGELNGIHYHFKNRETFEKMIENNEFIEFAEYSGNYYGTSKQEIEQKMKDNKCVVNVMEIVGAKAMKKIFPNTIIIYIDCPIDVMMQRMFDRGDDFSSIKKRVKNYVETREFENNKFADFIIDNSQSLEYSYAQLDEIINKLTKEEI